MVACGLVTVGVLGVWWNPTKSYDAVAVDGAAQAEPGDLQALAEQRVFFGHKSVGKNIMAGMEQVYAAHGVAGAPVIELEPGETTTLPEGGAFVHSHIGENYHPIGKLRNFDAMIRGGLGDQVDVAALKFCYIDIRWDSDVDGLFSQYQETMAQLQADYPDVRFIHVTAPLTTGPYGIRDHVKVLVGRNDNAARERYNDLMREAYGSDELFDLAALEATEPDGEIREQELFAGYSTDGAHLNPGGSEMLAAELVGFLAEAAR